MSTINCCELLSGVETLLIFFLQLMALAFDMLLLPIYYLVQRPWWLRRRARQPKAKVVAYDETSITIRSTQHPEKLHVELVRENITTMAQMFAHFTNKFGNKNCLGTRVLLEESCNNLSSGKTHVKQVFGDYAWKSYTEVNILAKTFGLGLRELGNKPRESVAIFAESRFEWMVAAQGLFKQNMPIVTVYANLGEDGVVHALNETRVSILITTLELMSKMRNIFARIRLLSTIIYMEHQIVKVSPEKPKDNIRVISFSDVLKLGYLSNASTFYDYSKSLGHTSCRYHNVAGDSCPQPSSTAIIMYTSGSTGTPKGVILTHANLLASLRGYTDSAHSFVLNQSDILVAFLPLAHVFELIVECVCLCEGIAIGYSNNLTLIDSSPKIKEGTLGDTSLLHPTIMTTVPLILDRISKGIKQRIHASNLLTRVLFHFSYAYKKYWYYRGYDTPLINKVIFRRATKIMGGKLRIILSGGAPLSPETHECIQLCLCAHVVQGYGLTETCSCATVMDGYDRIVGRVGGPTTVCDLRLVNCKEEGYSVKDKPYPQGEILVGGANVSHGYFGLEDRTREDFFDDECKRWFRTGDVGMLHNDGVISVIDRKKDLLKLQNGEYISLGRIEMEMKLHVLVDNICVFAQPTQEFCVALVVPNEAELVKFAQQVRIEGALEELCENRVLNACVGDALMMHGRSRNLGRNELPTRFKLCAEVWTPDNGLVTAAYKIRRKEIGHYYQEEINELFK